MFTTHFIFSWSLTLAMLILASISQADGLSIVVDGRSDYVIVIPHVPSEAERFAAEELALNIKTMSGAEMQIIDDSAPLPPNAILLGNTRHLTQLDIVPDWQALGKEGYLIRTTQGHLAIAGGRPRGTLYGVYDVLQKYWGCRWFTLDTSIVPHQPTLLLPEFNTMYRPVFAFRDIMSPGGSYGNGFPGQHDDSDDLADIYAARNRWNFVVRAFQDEYIDARFGGSFRIAYGPAHNYHYLVNPGIYAESHPEYFAQDEDGKRLNYPIRGGEVELCLSNPEVAVVAAKSITQWLHVSHDVDMVFIGQSDTPAYCKCENCEASRKRYGGWDSARQVPLPSHLPEDYRDDFGGFAGWQLEFVNRVARLLEKQYPTMRIGTYAYWHARKPPRDIMAHRNVVVWYCPLKAGPEGRPRRCYCHPIDGGPVNDDFESFGDELGEWTRISDHIYVCDYWLGTWMGQPVNIHTYRQTIRFYRKIGVHGIMLDGPRGVQGGFEWLTFWLWLQLAWDPDFDADQGIDEFCKAYYGAAGPMIRQYIELASQPENYGPPAPLFQTTSDAHLTRRFTEDPYRPLEVDKLVDCQMGFRDRAMTTDAINRSYDIFTKARSAVRNDLKASKHVEYAIMPLQLTMLENLPGNDPRLKDESQRLIQQVKQLGFDAIGYRSQTPDQFAASMKQKIETRTPLYPSKTASSPLY